MENKKKLSNNSTVGTVVMLLFSFACSLLLWVYVTDSEDDSQRWTLYGIPVVFEGESAMRESRGLIVSELATNSVSVQLTGSRRARSSLRSADLSAVIDLNNVSRTGSYYQVPQVRFPSGTDTSSVNAVTTPATVSFYVDVLDKKAVPVQGIFHGSIAEGYSAEPMEFSPNSVTAYGPKQLLEQISYAYVDVTRQDVDRTLTFDSSYILMDADGNAVEQSGELTYDTDTVAVTLPIQSVRSVALTVELVDGGGATGENNVVYSLDPEWITLTGDAEALAGLNSISVARVDLAAVDELLTETYPITIPNGTEITSGPAGTTLTLEIVGLEKRTFRISKDNITCTNSSEGYDWEVMSESLDVTLRGPAEALDAVSDFNIRAVADLTDYGTATGFVSVPVRIRVDGSTEVGALGKYQVYVSITEAIARDSEEAENQPND